MLLIISAISDEETRNKIELIYEEYASAMYFKANSILKNMHDAEDAVQLSFEKIIKNADKIETPIGNKTRSFVLIVVENTAIDLYRKRKNLSESPLDILEQASFRNVEYAGSNELVKQILKLSPKYRNIMILKYVHGYNYSEIGQIMGMSEDACKKAGQRAKEKLELMCKEH